MGNGQVEEKKYTVEEYLQLEEKSEIRHEFYDGDIFAIAGTTMNHNRIVGRIRSYLEGVHDITSSIPRPLSFPYFTPTTSLNPETPFSLNASMAK